MKAWIASLTPNDEQIALRLVERGCEFVWRKERTGEPGPSPVPTDTCWFEIWCSDELLSFVGPFHWPLPEGMVQTTGTFMIRQVESMMQARRR